MRTIGSDSSAQSFQGRILSKQCVRDIEFRVLYCASLINFFSTSKHAENPINREEFDKFLNKLIEWMWNVIYIMIITYSFHCF
jgi:hypothetical protein